MERPPGNEEAILRRLKWTAGGIAAAGTAAPASSEGGLRLSPGAGGSHGDRELYVLERVTAGLITPRIGRSARDFLVPGAVGAAVIPILLALLTWKKFDIFAGLFGFSVVVVAIGIEIVRGFGRS